jgi:hypothetical protein
MALSAHCYFPSTSLYPVSQARPLVDITTGSCQQISQTAAAERV